MTVLPPKSTRDLLGIDTISRAIAWSVLYLKAVQIEKDTDFINYINWTIQANNASTNFVAEIKLIYQRLTAINKGLDFISCITEFSDQSTEAFFELTTPASTELIDILPTELLTVNTVEKYLYWASSILVASTYTNTSFVSFQFFDAATVTRNGQTINEPYIKINLSLPLNYRIWLISGNIILSVERIIDVYINELSEVPNNPTFTPIDNTIQWEQINDKPDFHVVAESGDYEDLENLPVIPSKTSNLENDSGFIITVNNTLPDANGNVTITALVGSVEWSAIQNKPEFHVVAENGNYEQLNNKPAIPTKTSNLENDVGFIIGLGWNELENKPFIFPSWITSDKKTANFTAQNNHKYPCDTSTNAITAILPASGEVWVYDAGGNSASTGFGTNSLTIQPATGLNQTVMGDTSLVIDRGAIGFILELVGNDWRVSLAR